MNNEEDIVDYRITFHSDIDFFAEQLKTYIKIPKHYLNNKQMEMSKTSSDENISFNKENYLIINEKIKILEDYNVVIVRDKAHIIPDFFDKEQVKNYDVKTWEMIFYQIFATEITENLQKFNRIFEKK